jgi:flavin reductase (DIM6/NTAB) family NADH-FMN oxidoreductase RutF
MRGVRPGFCLLCVINISTVEIAEKVVGCGNTSGSNIDKFETVGVTAKRAAEVRPPLIEECFAQLECRVVHTTMVAGEKSKLKSKMN